MQLSHYLGPIYYVISVRKPIPSASNLPFPRLITSANLLSMPMNLPIPGILYQWNHTECGICVSFLSFSMALLRFTHTLACITILFIYMAISLYDKASFYLPIHLFIDIWFVFLFCLLWILLLWQLMYNFLFKPWFWILPVSQDCNCWVYTNFLLIVFYSSWIFLHSHQQYMRVPISSHPYQQLLFSIFF